MRVAGCWCGACACIDGPKATVDTQRMYRCLEQSLIRVHRAAESPWLPESAQVKKDVKTEVLLQSIGAEIVQLRSLDDELTRFEPEYALHKGSTENSYLIQVKPYPIPSPLRSCVAPHRLRLSPFVKGPRDSVPCLALELGTRAAVDTYVCRTLMTTLRVYRLQRDRREWID
jgi:hypothetical protein